MPHEQLKPLFRRALIALQRTDQDRDLLAYAGMLARQGVVGELTFIHVLPDSQPPADAAQEATILGEMKSETNGHLSGVPAPIVIRHELLRGPLIDRLLQYATTQQVDLALVGHRQDHPLRRSLARRLTKLAPCSVWLVPEGSAASIKRILVPIDFSPHAADALRVAVRLGALAGIRELTALHVYFDESRTTYEGADEAIRGDETEHFNAFVAPINRFGVAIKPLFREGVHPAHTIRHVVEELSIDLTVMETRGRTPSAAILLGSVAQETLVESRGPVLVVKHSGTQIGVLRAMLLKLFQNEPGTQFD
jgi:nucleotide-binding universal stress UspA family protein